MEIRLLLSELTIPWRLYGRLIKPFVLIVFLGVLSRGQTIFFPFLSIDTYEVAAAGDPSVKYQTLIQQGRFGLMALWWLRGELGIWGPAANSFSLVLSVPVLTLSGLIFAFAISRSMTVTAATILAAVYCLHPYLTEIYYFSDAAFNIFFAMLLSAIGLLFALQEDRQPAAWGIGVISIAVSISIYQLVVAHLGTAWLLSVVARSLRESDDEFSIIRRYQRQIRALAIMAVALALYLLMASLVARYTGWELDGRNGFSGLLDIRTKADAIRQALSLGYYPSAQLVPKLATNLLLIILPISATCLVLKAWLRRGFWISGAVFLCLVVAFVWSASASAAGNIIWIVPRVVSPASLFVGGVLALAMQELNLTVRRVLLALVAVILICYIGASNAILYDQRRINLWDAQQANRIVSRLELQPRFAEMNKVAFVGGQWWRTTPLPTAIGDMNVSALAVGWAKVQLISQATGYRYPSLTETEQAAAERKCQDRPVWPDINSVFIDGDTGIVCLTRPK